MIPWFVTTSQEELICLLCNDGHETGNKPPNGTSIDEYQRIGDESCYDKAF